MADRFYTVVPAAYWPDVATLRAMARADVILVSDRDDPEPTAVLPKGPLTIPLMDGNPAVTARAKPGNWRSCHVEALGQWYPRGMLHLVTPTYLISGFPAGYRRGVLTLFQYLLECTPRGDRVVLFESDYVTPHAATHAAQGEPLPDLGPVPPYADEAREHWNWSSLDLIALKGERATREWLSET